MSDTTKTDYLAAAREALGAGPAVGDVVDGWRCIDVNPGRIGGLWSRDSTDKDCDEVALERGDSGDLYIMGTTHARVPGGVLRCLFPTDQLRNAAPAIAALCDEVAELRSVACEHDALTGAVSELPIFEDEDAPGRRAGPVATVLEAAAMLDHMEGKIGELTERVATLEAEAAKARDDVAYLRSMAEAQSDDASEVLQSANAHIDALESERMPDAQDLPAGRVKLHAALADVGIATCGDNSCIFGPPGGMATNGGCRCLDRFGIDEHQLPREALAFIRRLASACRRLHVETAYEAEHQAARADAAEARIAELEDAAPSPTNLHPDGCHTTEATMTRNCASDGHHECVSCTRLERVAKDGDK